MIRYFFFLTVSLLITFFIYCVPVYYFLLGYNSVPSAEFCIAYALCVFGIILFYFSTSVSFYPLKAFVYIGLGAGFYGLIYSLVGAVLQLVFHLNLAVGMPIFVGFVTLIGALNARHIHLKEVKIPSKKVTHQRAVAFVSDIHLGSRSSNHLTKVLSHATSQPIDALLIGGDLIDSTSFNRRDLDLFKSIACPIYFVTGNHEYYLKNCQKILANLKAYGITIIDQKSTILNDVEILGIGDNQTQDEQLKCLHEFKGSDNYRVLLIHKPWLWPQAADHVDLMLSGHTHNGQLFPFNWLVKLQFSIIYGLHQIGSSFAYVSSGAGCWGPNLRIGSRNEVVVITIFPQ